MIDIHSHLIYDIDDGPSKIEDSLRMISEAEKLGIDQIIATLHFQESLYSLESAQERYQKLAHRALDFGITLKLGYEVYLSSIHEENRLKAEGHTLNNTRYMLVEFPFNEFHPRYIETMYAFQSNGIIPIISHPERCRYFIENANVLDSFLEGGCLVQIDAASILGVYGCNVKKMATELIKSKKADFVATNAHFSSDYVEWYKKAHHTVSKIAGEEYTEQVFNLNARKITEALGKSALQYSII